MRPSTSPTFPVLAIWPLAFALAASGQGAGSPGQLPATAPTQSVSNLPSAQPGASGTTPQSGARAESRVTWDSSRLAIDGSGDSLRNILLKVSRLTGMKITGSIPSEPVFGQYGPASAQKVLADLMSGSGVNMLLVNGTPVLPKELVLTARTGVPTPPSARSQTAADYQDPAPVQQQNFPQYRPHNGQPPPGTPGIAQDGAQQQQPANGFGGGAYNPATNTGTNQTSDGSTTPSTTDANGTPQSPNGVRTPEQIFEELRRRAQSGTQQ